jgi:hypothetical protein
VEPHTVNPPLSWWIKLNAWDAARAKRQARETVERKGLAQSDPDTQRIYNDLMLELRGIKSNGH